MPETSREEGHEHKAAPIPERRANRLARDGLGGAIDAPETTEVSPETSGVTPEALTALPKTFEIDVVAVLEQHNNSTNKLRLFYGVFGFNLGDATEELAQTYKAGLRALHEACIISYNRKTNSIRKPTPSEAEAGTDKILETAAEKEAFKLPGTFEADVVAIVMRRKINRRRLFYELFKFNVEDVSRAHSQAFSDGIRDLIAMGIIQPHSKDPHLLEVSSKPRHDHPLPPVPPPTVKRSAVGEHANLLVIPPYFEENVRALLANNGGTIHLEDIITKLFPGEDMFEENYQTLVAAMDALADKGVLIDQGEGHYLVFSQPSPSSSPKSYPTRRRGSATYADRRALDDMIKQSGLGQPQPAKPSKKRRRNRGRTQ